MFEIDILLRRPVFSWNLEQNNRLRDFVETAWVVSHETALNQARIYKFGINNPSAIIKPAARHKKLSTFWAKKFTGIEAFDDFFPRCNYVNSVWACHKSTIWRNDFLRKVRENRLVIDIIFL